ncbi:MAG: hypothetical protein KatS3mg122_1388 [Caldimonas sp.]|nr:MAG: hypothetical protein KatS3mg122_1388 [Caldimonas sp.]
MPRSPSWPTSGCTPSRAPTRRWRWPWATSSCKEFHVERRGAYFEDYARRYTDLPMLVRLGATLPDGRHAGAGPLCARQRLQRQASDRPTTPNGRRWPSTRWATGACCPHGSIGFRWGLKPGDAGQWNLENKEARHGRGVKLQAVAAGEAHGRMTSSAWPSLLWRHRPRHFRHNAAGRRAARATSRPSHHAGQGGDGEALVATVFDLLVANYGLDRGLPAGDNVAATYDDDVPYTPKWQEAVTGVPAEQVITVARQFADNADKTHGKSMVIIGAAMNHWYHSRHELPRHHQHADAVRVRRPERRRLGALRRSGEAAPADRLDGRWPSRWTGSARRASRTPPASSMRIPTSGATRSWGWKRSCHHWPTRPSSRAA